MRDALVESSLPLSDVDEEDIDLGERNIKQRKRKICDGHYIASVQVLSSLVVAPYNEATLEDLNTKNPFKPPLSLPHISIDHHLLVASPAEALDRIKSFLRGTSRGRDGLLGEYIASAPLTLLVNLGGGTRHIVVVWCWGGNGSEGILHFVNRLIEACGDAVGLSMLLVDFKNAFNLVDQEVMLREVCLRCTIMSCWGEFCYSNPARLYYESTPYGHAKECNKPFLHALYLDEGTFIGDIVVVRKVLELIMEDGPGCVMHLNVDKTKGFWPNKNPRSRLAEPILSECHHKSLRTVDSKRS
nr:hypothetical protein [Tanacetum cinerariifolium]